MKIRAKLYLAAGIISLISIQAHADVVEVFKKERPQLIVEGKDFTEGPTLDQHGNILFTAPRLNSIISYSISDRSETQYYKGEYSVSALFIRDGVLYATQGSRKRVIRIKSPDEFVTLADSFSVKPFNKPNYL